MAERKVVVGVFQERAQARKAVADLESAGFTEKQIGFAILNPDGAGEPPAGGRGDTEPRRSDTAEDSHPY